MANPLTRCSLDGAQDLRLASDERRGQLPPPLEGSGKGDREQRLGVLVGYSERVC